MLSFSFYWLFPVLVDYGQSRYIIDILHECFLYNFVNNQPKVPKYSLDKPSGRMWV